jgi:pectinesterase
MYRSFILMLIVLLTAIPAGAQERGVRVRVDNPSLFPRIDELIEVPWSDLLRYVPTLAPSGFAVEDSASGKSLPSQVIDLDGDGRPDLLLVRVALQPGASVAFNVVRSSAPPAALPSLTDARFVLPREDLAWENDRIAFRMYGPALAKEVDNGIDVWTKRVRSLIVQKWYKAAQTALPGHDPYHEDHGEGADFFAVGRSLGAGACALISGDSLLQPGVFAGYRIIATGPLRAMFELSYNPVLLGTRKVTQKMRIAIDAGSNFNRIDVLFDAKGPALPFAAGVVKRNGVTGHADSGSCAASLWGLTTERQEEGFLGTGIVMPKSICRGIRETPLHLLVLGVAEAGKRATYYAGAGWTKSGDFSTEDEWIRALRTCALKMESPLTLTVSAAH